MAADGGDAAPTMIEALKANRQDIVRTLAEHMAKLPSDTLAAVLQSTHAYSTVVEHEGDAASTGSGTLLHLAVAAGQADAVRTLLQLGADPSAQDSGGKSAIVLATAQPAETAHGLAAAFTTMFLQHISQSEVEPTRRMLVGGIDVNGSDGGRKQNRPLHWACGFGTPEIVALLCRNGADVNLGNADGGMPLHDAAERGDAGIIRVLLDHGANRRAKFTAGSKVGRAPVHVVTTTAPERLAEIRALLSDGVVEKEEPSPSDGAAAAAAAPAAAPAVSTNGEADVKSAATTATALSASSRTVQKVTDHRLKLLWPAPRRLVQLTGPYIVLPKAARASVVCSDRSFAPSVEHVWDRLVRELDDLGVGVTRVAPTITSAPHISLQINRAVAPSPQMYRMSVEARGVTIVAGDSLGLHYGITTFIQLVRLCGASPKQVAQGDGDMPSYGPGMPPLKICDQPALLTRAFMLDVSRNKVPKLSTLRELVDTLVLFKFNQLQLYFEHTFAYSGHKVVWDGSDAYHGHEMLALSEYCHVRGVTLVPNQNSFGHFHRWLVHERYRGLAECPDGADIGDRPSGPRDAPFSLCPVDRACLRLMQGLYSELDANFPHSEQIHVGLDETADIGMGRSKDACERAKGGVDDIYLDYLMQIRTVAYQQRRTIQFWADMVQQMPDESLLEIPADTVACEWGYEDDHPFDDRCRRLANAGVAFMVCPGTSSWNALCGRTANCIENIRQAVTAGVAHGAVGLLLTDWGDAGHTQPRALSYPGITTAGGCAWNPDPLPVTKPKPGIERTGDWVGEWGDRDVAKLLDTYIFWDTDVSVGNVITELGNTYLHTGGGTSANTNGTALFRMLMFPGRDAPAVPEGITSAGLRSAAKHARDLIEALDTAAEQTRLCDDIEGIRIAVDMTVLACRLGQALLRHQCQVVDLPLTQRTDLANRLIPIAGRLSAHWKQQNRHGGLDDTMELLSTTVSVLLGTDGIETANGRAADAPAVNK
mmetsp:Transcript_1588/g.5178  ORF Transcript_1588/g.5178 Transcript_1588/m.5178 type:complete len:992 (-) Transcript_1588:112-3087(-)